MGEIKKPFIAIPVYGNVDVHFFDATLKFVAGCAKFPHELRFHYGDSLVSRARNYLTAQFLKSDCTHLLFVDSDLVWSQQQVERLLSHDVDIVGGFYPKKKQGKVEFVFNHLTPEAKMDADSKLTEVLYIGTGFICITRRVLEKMIETFDDSIIFKVDGSEKYGFDFWKVGVYQYPDKSRRYLSEDWYFCQLARDLGFKVYGDCNVMLRHSGGAVYPLESQAEQIFIKPTKQKNENIPDNPDLGVPRLDCQCAV